MPITINDVAKEAGVSPSTVSKVLNNWTTISDATIARVNAAIEKLHYTPNARAVSFARQSTKNIVFLTSLSQNEAYKNPHMFDIMCGVQNELAKEGYTLTLVDTSLEQYPGETVEKLMAQKCADGFVIHGSAINESVGRLLVTQQFAHIVIGRPDFTNQLCWIDTNNTLAGEFAAEHMLRCEYTDVAFIGGKKNDMISFHRQRGFLGLMNKYGYQVNEENIIYTNYSIQESYEEALKLLQKEHRPRAIVCENNLIALGVVKAVEKCHLSIPDDIAFITFDAYPYSAIIDPTPTIVDISMYDMGIQAGLMMLHKIKNPSLQIQSYTTLPILIQGKTTCPKEKDV